MTEDRDVRDVDDRAGDRPVSATVRIVLVTVLSLLLLLSIGTFVGLAVSGQDSPTRIFSGDGDDEERSRSGQDRQQVMAQAQRFMVRVNTYGRDLLADDGTMPDYRDKVLELITSKLAESFEQTVAAAEATVAQAGAGRTTEIFGVGISAIDADSAAALVAGSFTNSFPTDPDELDGERSDLAPIPFRIEVKLDKVQGEWLVDSFDPVLGIEDPAGTPSDAPSPSSANTTPPAESPGGGGSS